MILLKKKNRMLYFRYHYAKSRRADRDGAGLEKIAQ